MLTDVHPAAEGEALQEGVPALTRAGRLLSPLTVILVVASLALAFRVALLLVFPFDGLYGQDAFFYLSSTRELVAIWTDPARLRDWLTVPGTPPVSVWPLGYHIQMALAAVVTGLGPASGQLVSLLAGVLTPAWTVLLTWQLLRPREGDKPNPTISHVSLLLGSLIAGLIVACVAIAVRASLVVMADMAAVHWASAGVLGSVFYLRDPKARMWLGLLAGLCLGIAAVTRYIFPLILLPVAMYAILGARAAGRQGRPLFTIARQLSPLVVPTLLLFGGQLLHNAIHPMPTLPSPVISTWNPLNAFGSSFDGPDGHQVFSQPMFVFYLLRPLLSTTMLGAALAPFVLLGIAALFSRRLAAAGGLLLGWWLLFAGVYTGSIYQADRFVLSYLPPLAVLAGLGFAWLSEHAIGLWLSGARRLRGPLLACVSLLVLLAGVATALQIRAAAADFRGLQATKEEYLSAVRCLMDRTGPSPSVPVFSFAVTFTLKEYTSLEPKELYFETPGSVDRALSASRNDVRGYLLLPVTGFEEQWSGTSMGATYRHLKANYRLTALPCPAGSFTLFEIGRGG